MTYVRSFDGFKPPPRYDGVPFTDVGIQESASSGGPWVELEEVALSPVDTDPSDPQERDVTTSLATLTPVAWYRLVWRDAADSEFRGTPILFDTQTRLANYSDVERVLQTTLTEEQRDDVDTALQAADEWARKFLNDDNVGADESVVESFYDIRHDGAVPVKGTVTKVETYASAGADADELDPDYWTHDGVEVRFRPAFTEVEATTGATVRTIPGVYTQVDVTVTRGDVPASVRDAVALAGAALFTRSPRLAKGLTGENIGDYGYTVAQLLTGDPFFEQAKVLLRPYRRRGPLVP